MGARRTLQEQIDSAYADQQRGREFVERLDRENEAAREQERKDQAAREVEDLARTRLSEWLAAGGTEQEFRREWPRMLREHLDNKRGAEDAAHQRLVDSTRDQIF